MLSSYVSATPLVSGRPIRREMYFVQVDKSPAGNIFLQVITQKDAQGVLPRLSTVLLKSKLCPVGHYNKIQRIYRYGDQFQGSYQCSGVLWIRFWQDSE